MGCANKCRVFIGESDVETSRRSLVWSGQRPTFLNQSALACCNVTYTYNLNTTKFFSRLILV